MHDQLKIAKERGIPVLDYINGIDGDYKVARVLTDYYETGHQVGEYLKQLHPAQDEKIQVAWFPGPKGPGWSARGDKGFRASLAGSNIEIIDSRWGDTGKTVQEGLIEQVLENLGPGPGEKLDYIVGTTVSAEAAVSLLLKRGLKNDIKVLAYYYGPGVHKGIRRGSIVAAPTKSHAINARIAVDTLVRVLEGRPYFKQTASRVQVIDCSNQSQWDASTTLPPRGFRPVFTIGD